MKLGLIAGAGELPEIVARHRKAEGAFVHVVAIKGFEEAWIEDYSHEVCGIAEVGRVLKSFKSAGCDTISMIGNIKRPDFSALKPDLKGLSLLPKIIGAARKGDDPLLRVIVEIFEDEGFSVIGVQDLLQELVLDAQWVSGSELADDVASDIQRAFDIAGLIGEADIGQGSVVCEGLVLAVEAQEGTDAMLKRVSQLPQPIRGTEEQRRGVLVKRPKPIQERRVDLPVLGPSTVRLAAEAGLIAVCGVAGGALWVEQAEMKRLAEAMGIALVSLQPDGRLP